MFFRHNYRQHLYIDFFQQPEMLLIVQSKKVNSIRSGKRAKRAQMQRFEHVGIGIRVLHTRRHFKYTWHSSEDYLNL